MITHGWADERTDDVHVPQYANCHVGRVGGDKETTSAAAASSDLVLYGEEGGEEEKSREAAKSGSLTG